MVFKDLTKQVKWLDIILGNVLEVIKNIQRDSLRAKGIQEPELKANLDSLNTVSTQLKQEITDQIEALKVLQRTPPSFLTTMLDFATTVLTEKPGTRRKDYFEKLRAIDQKINRTMDPVNSAISNTLTALNISPAIVSKLEQAMYGYLNARYNNTPFIQEAFDNFKQIASTGVSPEDLKAILESLKKTLYSGKKYPIEQTDKIINELGSVKGVKIAGWFSKKTITPDELITNFDKYKKQMDNLENEMKKILTTVDGIFQNVSAKKPFYKSKASEAQELSILQKYNTFFNAMLSTQGRLSVDTVNIIADIESTLVTLNKIQSNQTQSNQTQQSNNTPGASTSAPTVKVTSIKIFTRIK